VITLDDVIKHARDREFMSGVERDHARVKATGEVFTPTELVQQMLDELPQELFTDPTKTFIDPACGDGQFLSEVLIRKMQNGIDFETALKTIYGIDIMPDNVRLCRQRLMCGQLEMKSIVYRNVITADGLESDYGFGRKPPPEPVKLSKAEKAALRAEERAQRATQREAERAARAEARAKNAIEKAEEKAKKAAEKAAKKSVDISSGSASVGRRRSKHARGSEEPIAPEAAALFDFPTRDL
jgi:N-6 DNA Methylase